jgi:hypothetical protein
MFVLGKNKRDGNGEKMRRDDCMIINYGIPKEIGVCVFYLFIYCNLFFKSQES